MDSTNDKFDESELGIFYEKYLKFVYFIRLHLEENDEYEQLFDELLKKSNLIKIKDRIFTILKPIIKDINNDNIFINSFMLLPHINLSDIWKKMNNEEKEDLRRRILELYSVIFKE